MYKLFIANRYLRSRAISLVSIVGIFLSVGALIVVISVMSGFLRESKAFIRGTMSDIVVVPAPVYVRMPDGRRMRSGGPDFEAIRSIVTQIPGVNGVAPRFGRPALIRRSDGRDSLMGMLDVSQNAVEVVGIDLEMEQQVTSLERYLTSVEDESEAQVADLANPFHVPEEMLCEEYFMSDFPCALVGESKFNRLRLKRGDVITMVTLDVDAAIQGKEIKPFEQKFFVAGAFKSGHYQFDSQTILVPLHDAWAWVGTQDEVSEVYVAVDRYAENGPQIAEAIDIALEEASIPAWVATWEERNSVFLGAVENERTILGVILGFFILIATFNVFATTSMMVTDKTKDIGILVSMGATPGGILGIFLGCGVLMWLVGSSLGAVAGYLFADNINPIKNFIERTLGVEVFRSDVYNFKEIPVEINAQFIALTLLGTLVLSLFFAFIPAIRAALTDPVETLRHE